MSSIAYTPNGGLPCDAYGPGYWSEPVWKRSSLTVDASPDDLTSAKVASNIVLSAKVTVTDVAVDPASALWTAVTGMVSSPA